MTTDTRPPTPPRLAVRLLALGVSVVVCLVLLEALLRLAGFEYVPVSIQADQGGDARAFHVFEDRNFAYDPDLAWRPRPGQSVFNEQGFRGPVLDPDKPAREFRVFTVGDSNTLGWAGDDGPNWPADLGRLIAGVRPESKLVNAGVWGYASYQGLHRFREVLTFAPDLVLVSFGSNDAHRVARPDEEYASDPARDTALGRALAGLRLGQLAMAAFEGASSEPRELQPRVSLDAYREHLRSMVVEGRERGTRVVLLTRPYIGPIDNPYWWKNWGADYNTATIEVAREQDVVVVDVYTYFKGRDELFADESHFTAEGHELAAQVIFDRLRPLVGRPR